ncbi:polymer-forming cytoskeletal protein [Pasteurellaceae bacterium TAE3-ERU1]|nr:polymer-forming cytoskeletal protein [Pasteurellaceae bacterium TAE3-ERU1]
MKYEKTDESVEFYGKTLYRIRALKSFGDVQAGDLGGYIEGENNLSHDGDCWVFGNAKVWGYAQVYGNAKVCGYAQVWGDAQVYGNAKVCGYAQVCGKAEVWGYAQVYGNAEVWGYAQVYGNAKVCGYAQVYGNAEVWGDAQVYGNAKVCGYAHIKTKNDTVWFSNVGAENGTLTVFKGSDGGLLATRGCFHGTVDEFLTKSKEFHDETIHREYAMMIDVAKLRLNRPNR